MAEWFQEWFGEDYLRLYPHRDAGEASRLVALLQRRIPWQAGWSVLDVGCGAGRHLAVFEAAGFRPIGMDLSRTLLQRARQASRRPLVRADMRHLPIRAGRFDLVVNLFTSFGYFSSDAEHAGVVGQMAAALRPGGWLVLDFLNAPAVRTGLVADETVALGGGPAQVSRRLEDGDRTVVKTIATSDGRRFVERVRLYETAELEAMLATAGVSPRERLGDYDGNPLSGASPRAILIGQRP
jgi:SAM-dependent methyltransferase